MSSTGASLLDLPAELLDSVLVQTGALDVGSDGEPVDVKYRISTLCSWSRTCRSLSAYAMPLLFRTIRVSGRTADSTLEILQQLCQTITSRPDLARKTTTLCIGLQSFKTNRRVPKVTIDTAGKTEELYLRELLHRLLCQLTNVKALYFCTDTLYSPHMYLWRDFFSVNGHDTGHSGFLPSLETFRASPNMESSEAIQLASCVKTRFSEPEKMDNFAECTEFYRDLPFNLTDYEGLFCHPSLKALRLTLVAGTDHCPGWSPMTLEPGSSNITKLELLRCHIKANTLERILAACTRLKILKLDCNGSQGVARAMMALVECDEEGRPVPEYIGVDEHEIEQVDPTMTVKDLQRALDPCAETLEELLLNVKTVGTVGTGIFNGTCLSLRHFLNLRKLIASVEFMPAATDNAPNLECIGYLQSYKLRAWYPCWPFTISPKISGAMPSLQYVRYFGCGALMCTVPYVYYDDPVDECDGIYTFVSDGIRIEVSSRYMVDWDE